MSKPRSLYSLRNYQSSVGFADLSKILAAFLTCLTITIPSDAVAEQLSLQNAMLLTLQHNFDLHLSSLNVDDKASAITKAQSEFDTTISATVNRDHSESPSASSLDGVTTVVRSDALNVKPTLSKKFQIGTELSVPYTYGSSESNSSYNRLPVGHSTALTAKIIQPLIKPFFSGYILRNVHRATLDLSIARAKHGEKLDDSALKAAEIFLDALRAHETMRVEESNLQNAGFIEAATKAKQEVGKAGLIEFLEAQAARVKILDAFLDYQAAYASKLDELASHVFGKSHMQIELSSDLGTLMEEPKELNYNSLLSTAIKQRHEYTAQIGSQEKAEVETAAAQVDLLPTLNFEGSYTHKGLAGDFGTSEEQIHKGTYPGWSVGFKIERPVVQLAATSAVDIKRLQLAQQAIKQVILNRDIELEVRKALRETHSNWQRLNALTLASRAQTKRFEVQSAKYKSGQISISELNRARVDSETAEVEMIKSRFTYAKAKLRLQASTGTILDRVK